MIVHIRLITDGAGGSSGAASDRDSFSRWRDRQYYGPRRWFQSARDETQWDKDSGKNLFFFNSNGIQTAIDFGWIGLKI